MDPVKFLKEGTRMCKDSKECEKCPLDSAVKDCVANEWSAEEREKAVETVEKWSKENPPKTRGSILLEQYPGAQRYGHIAIKPCDIDEEARSGNFLCDIYGDCWECKKAYWNEEVGK